MSYSRVLVLGGRSLIGGSLLSGLAAAGFDVSATTRRTSHLQSVSRKDAVKWHWLESSLQHMRPVLQSADVLINLAPLWELDPYLEQIRNLGIRRIIAFSSTSVFTKRSSANTYERTLVARLVRAEENLATFCEAHGIDWTVLRSTLIYGDLRPGELSAIGPGLATVAKFVWHTRHFPLVNGAGAGLRQPVHIDDLASACIELIGSAKTHGRIYNVRGAETLTYRTMVERIAYRLGVSLKFVPVPLGALRCGLAIARHIPRFHFLNPEMANRMNVDLVFDHQNAVHDFGFSPRGFMQPCES